MTNKNLSAAKTAKNDEFYTQYSDIQKEVNAYIEYDENVFRGKTVLCPCDDPEWSNFTKFFAKNFDNLGLKKLISTSYAYDSKNPKPDFDWQPTLFETENAEYDAAKSPKHGKIFTLTQDEEPPRDVDKLKWHYLEGDGDFRSKEVSELLKEADIVITNPPFSLFREFIAWIFEENKKFLVIGNKNAITYKEIFPLIKENKLWIGKTPMSTDLLFDVPNQEKFAEKKKVGSGYRIVDGTVYARAQAIWFTNLDHGRRHTKMNLMPMSEHLRHSKHSEIKEFGYPKYDNYDAIEVSFADAIPSDYEGIMGVPISFLDKYCPEQFEILNLSRYLEDSKGMSKAFVEEYYRQGNKGQITEGHPDLCYYDKNGKTVVPYMRILIRNKK